MPDAFPLAEPPRFPFPALAAGAARAALGGPRESALAILLTARLAAACLGPGALAAAVRGERAVAARQWLSTLAVPGALKIPVARALDATGHDDAPALAAALQALADAGATVLDPAALGELRALVTRVTA